jgi:hypothetical protein
MNETVKAWQCIGCGKIDAPQTCVGVCQDRKVEFVYASEHMEALTDLAPGRLGTLLSGIAGAGTLDPGRNPQWFRFRMT